MNGLHTLTRAQRERITTLPVSRLDPMNDTPAACGTTWTPSPAAA